MKYHRPLRVLFVGLKYDYGDPRRGPSFEYENFFGTLSRMEGVEATLFPFDEVMLAQGRAKMNMQLIEKVTVLAPDICFFFLFTDEITRATIRTISSRDTSVTVNWFADDQWRFNAFSRQWAPLFHWAVTTDPEATEKYHHIGFRNVIESQWGYNHYVYKQAQTTETQEVTFIGQVHSHRRKFMRTLERSGIRVECWGRGWPNGRLSQDDMIRLYSASKINLNFSESSFGLHLKTMLKVVVSRRADDSLTINTPGEMAAHIATLFSRRRAQIKGRTFEIPGAGGFLLTQDVDGIEKYFVPGREIVTFDSEDDLREKIHYFLTHESEREAIRRAGHERASANHTYQKRFEDIFRIMMTENRPGDAAARPSSEQRLSKA